MRCACHEVCTSRFTMRCACHEICTSRFTKCCASQEISTSRFTKCCTCHEICTSRLRGSQGAVPATKSARRGSQSAVPATKSANEPRVQKSRFTAPVTKSELLDDHHHVQSAVPATKTAFRGKTPPIPCACHEKSTLEHQNTRFPLRLPRKVATMCENARGRRHNETRNTRRGPPDSASLRSRNAH